MLIEIKGVQFVNKGAELMLFAILDKIHELWPEAEVCMEPNINSTYIDRAKIGAYQKLRLIKNRFDFNWLGYLMPKKFRESLKGHIGVVFESDVDIVLDASGFAYGDQWSYLPLLQMANIAQRLKRKGKKYILMPQALGPFNRDGYNREAKKLLDNCAIVFARDEQSLAYARACSIDADIQLASDFTNLFIPKPKDNYKDYVGKVAIIPNSKIVSDKNKSHNFKDAYLDTLCKAVTCAHENDLEVFILNHEGMDDLAICESLNKQFNRALDIISPATAEEVKSVIGTCSAVISSRFHGCVSALSQQIPCIGTSWSHKYDALYKDYGQQQYLLNEENLNNVEQVFDNFFTNMTQIRAELMEPASSKKSEVRIFWQQLSELVART